MLTEIPTDTTQLFAGARLSQTNPECTVCNRTLREGEQVTIYAARKEDSPTYRIERIYCRECTPEELTAPTLGLNEHLLHSRLTRTLDVQTQSEFYTLHEPHPIATSAPSEGTAEAHDEPEEPSALIRDPQSQTSGRTVYHLDNGADQPLCNCRGEAEYTSISLAEAETRPARRCQNCQIVHQGGQKARPCPHCSSEVKLSAWPQHVRACTSDPTDATEETDPDGDPAITNSDTQQTTSPTTQRAFRLRPARTPNCRRNPYQRWTGPSHSASVARPSRGAPTSPLVQSVVFTIRHSFESLASHGTGPIVSPSTLSFQ